MQSIKDMSKRDILQNIFQLTGLVCTERLALGYIAFGSNIVGLMRAYTVFKN